MKLRPVLLLTGPIGPVPEVLVAYISSVLPTASERLPSDLILDPADARYASSNLKATSVVRLHKLATIHRRNLVRHVGALSGTAWNEVHSKLRALMGL